MRERRLPKPRRSVQPNVLQRLPTALGGGDRDLELIDHLLLTDTVLKSSRPQGEIRSLLVASGRLARDDSLHWHGLTFCPGLDSIGRPHPLVGRLEPGV